MAQRTFNGKNNPTERILKQYTIPARGSVKIPIEQWGSGILYGLLQGEGSRFLYVAHTGSNSFSVTNLVTGEPYTSSLYTFAVDSSDYENLTMSTTHNVPSLFSIWHDMPKS